MKKPTYTKCISCRDRHPACQDTCAYAAQVRQEVVEWKKMVIQNKKRYGQTYIPSEARTK